MKHLLDDLEIESIIIVREANNENHVWNLVKIDGEYYHIDPTWDSLLYLFKKRRIIE